MNGGDAETSGGAWHTLTKRRILVALAAVTCVAVIVTAYVRDIRIWSTGDGWTCSSGTAWSLGGKGGLTALKPVVCGKSLVVIARKSAGAADPQGYHRLDAWEVVGLDLRSGRVTYRTPIRYEDKPVQVFYAGAWGKECVLFGTVSLAPPGPESFNLGYVVIVLSEDGNPTRSFTLPWDSRPKGFDGRHGMVICHQRMSSADLDNERVRDVLIGYDIRSGDEVLREEVVGGRVDYLITDGAGHLYTVLWLNLDNPKAPRECIVKYSLRPWQRKWSSEPLQGEESFRVTLHGITLWPWFYPRNKSTGQQSTEACFIGPFDARDGRRLETQAVRPPECETVATDEGVFLITVTPNMVRVQRR